MDVTALHIASFRLADAAELLRARAARLAVHAAYSRWQSPAAEAFADRLGILVRTLDDQAERLDDLVHRFRARAAALEWST